MLSKFTVKEFKLLAKLYHAHHKQYQEDLPYWESLAKQFGDPILELGCGSGRVLLALAEAGYAMHGLDNDPKMLDIINSNSDDDLIKRVTVWEDDMTAFESDLRYPLIVMPCNTYSTLSKNERAAVLGRVRQHLSRGGSFAASIPNPCLLDIMSAEGESEVEELITHPETGNPVQVSSSWRKQIQAVEIYWHYDHLLPDGKVERTTTSTTHQLLSIQDYQKEFVQSGFDIKASFGDFDNASYDEQSKYYSFQLAARS